MGIKDDTIAIRDATLFQMAPVEPNLDDRLHLILQILGTCQPNEFSVAELIEITEAWAGRIGLGGLESIYQSWIAYNRFADNPGALLERAKKISYR